MLSKLFSWMAPQQTAHRSVTPHTPEISARRHLARNVVLFIVIAALFLVSAVVWAMLVGFGAGGSAPPPPI